jgi:FAD:protein FMN transferase
MDGVAHAVAMDTVVSIEIVDQAAGELVPPALERALAWFRAVEQTCSRFDPASELCQLLGQVGTPVPVSPMLFEAVRFALALAELTGGAFDPTIGRTLEQQEFNRNYVTGERIAAGQSRSAPAPASRVVQLDPERLTITLARPMVLDLGAGRRLLEGEGVAGVFITADDRVRTTRTPRDAPPNS